MTTRLRRGGYRRRRGAAGGVAFVYFTLIGLPFLFFGAGLAVDFTRVILAHRAVVNATQAAALSGAQQFTPNAASINPEAARVAALDTYCVAQDNGELPHIDPAGGGTTCPDGTGRVTLDVIPLRDPVGTAVGVKVAAHYKVSGLLFGSFFGVNNAFTPAPVTRSAAICLPGVLSGPTNGYCTHPTAG